jgi:hypothetical protein
VGNELKGAVRTGKERHEGKILLETDELIFRGADYRLKLAFHEMRDVKAVNGELRVGTKDAVLTFEVGTAAEKWREKILHPKTLMEKLGMKAGMLVCVVGEFEADFMKELKSSEVVIQASNPADTQNTFLAIGGKNSLAAIAKCAKKIKGAEALWVVYPKGKKEITESDVISAGRGSGLKDVKVVGFSKTRTALKFVLPLGKR